MGFIDKVVSQEWKTLHDVYLLLKTYVIIITILSLIKYHYCLYFTNPTWYNYNE